MTTDPKERTTVRPRLLARLVALSVVAVLALLGAGVASAATTPVVTVTVGQVRQLLPLCPVAWSLADDDDPRLPDGLGRDVVVGTCLQHLGQFTRLSRTATTPPPPGTTVPPGADGRPVEPFVVRIVTRFSSAEPTPSPQPTAAPTRPSATVAPATPRAAAPGGSPGRAGAVTASPRPMVVPAAPGGGARMGGGAPAAGGGGPAAGAGGSAAGAEVSVDAAAGALPADLFPAAVEAPAPPVEKASIFGLPGTVSDPAALAAQVAAATGSSVPFLLAVALVVLALVGLLLWWGLRGEDLSQRLRDVLARVPFLRRPATEHIGPEGGDDDLAPADLVDRWLHADDEVDVPSPREPHDPTTARTADVVV